MAKDDELIKIKELLEIVKHKIDLSETLISGQSASVRLMRDQLSVMNRKIDDMQESVDANTASLVEVEKILGGYKESYQENQRNIYRLDDRLVTAEDKLAIEPPEDLKVPHFVE